MIDQGKGGHGVKWSQFIMRIPYPRYTKRHYDILPSW